MTHTPDPKTIDISSWPRRKHFALFNQFDYPHFNLTANVDISETLSVIKEKQLSVTITMSYLLARAANEIANFRWRIRGTEVVEHTLVHPSTTILTKGDLFSYCTMPYLPSFPQFSVQAMEKMEDVKKNPTLEDEPGQDNLLFMSSIPWVSFTSMTHPIHMHPVDSVPRMVWGKFFTQDDRTLMPLGVQAHHALMDGVHLGMYFNKVQTYLTDPNSILE